MKIKWAPLNVPLKRRIQTFMTSFFIFNFFAMPLLSPIIIILLLYYGNFLVRMLVAGYLVFAHYEHKGNFTSVYGNGWLWNRNNAIYRTYRNYFPVDLVKTAELPADRNYVVASFPHGVIGIAAVINMGLDIGKWLDFFPKVRPKLGTLDHNLRTPILRELLRWWGFISVSKDSLMYYLTQSNDPKHSDNRDGFTSNAIGILVGGAQEALDAHPGKYILTLRNRKGFVKIAIRSGSSIVPTISFGEVDIYEQVKNPPDSMLRRIQTMFKKVTGISPLLVIGRGYFNYSFGFLPHRKPIIQVVGAPIDVVKDLDPTADYVDEIHGKVIESLEEMFEKHKWKYVTDPENTKLTIQ